MTDVAGSRGPLFVACGCLIDDGSGRYLLVRETKPAARDRLALPAGVLEAGESLEQAAMREAKEETGLDVTIDGLLGIFHTATNREGAYGVSFVFAASIVGGQLTPSDEHPEFQWLSHSEIVELAARNGLRGRHAIEASRRFESGALLPPGCVTEINYPPRE